MRTWGVRHVREIFDYYGMTVKTMMEVLKDKGYLEIVFGFDSAGKMLIVAKDKHDTRLSWEVNVHMKGKFW